MQAMALVWEDDLRDLSDKQFIAALSTHRKNSRYWPTPAHILEAHSSTIPNRPPMLALEEHVLTLDERRMFGVNAAMATAYLKGSERADDYFKTDDPEEREAIAAEVLGARYVSGEVQRQRGTRRFMQ